MTQSRSSSMAGMTCTPSLTRISSAIPTPTCGGVCRRAPDAGHVRPRLRDIRAYPPATHSGVVVLRLTDQRPDVVADVLRRFVADYDLDTLRSPDRGHRQPGAAAPRVDGEPRVAWPEIPVNRPGACRRRSRFDVAQRAVVADGFTPAAVRAVTVDDRLDEVGDKDLVSDAGQSDGMFSDADLAQHLQVRRARARSATGTRRTVHSPARSPRCWCPAAGRSPSRYGTTRGRTTPSSKSPCTGTPGR